MAVFIYAELVLRSTTMSVDEMARLLKLKHNKTRPVRRHHQLVNEWIWVTPKREESNEYHLAHCFEEICIAIQPDRESVAALVRGQKCEARFSGVLKCEASRAPILVFPNALLAQIQELGASMDVDIYSLP